jgi:RimJ/RimL family protein N-acetyltransferase
MQVDRVQLRKPHWKDTQFIRWLWSDPGTMQPVGGSIQLTEEEARRWFEERIDPGSQRDSYRLILDQENRPVGEISYHHLDPETMTASFNVKIAHAERGRGYAREAMQLFLDEFFNQVGGRTLIDDVALDNVAGQQALLQFGFEHDSSVGGVFRLRLTREQFNRLYG